MKLLGLKLGLVWFRRVTIFTSSLLFIVFLTACSSNSTTSNRSGGSSRSVKDVNLAITKKTLENGLTIILTENKKLPLFSFYSIVKVGSRNETPGITGASHFLEHMMFKGSANYNLGDFEKVVSGNGGTYNAYTSKDLTVYYENLPIDALDKIIDLEVDRLFSLSLEENSFQKERNVILEERKYRYENSARGQLIQEVFKRSFKGTPYEIPTIGTIKDIKSVTGDQIRKHFKTFYTPENIVISIAGDFDTDDLMEKLEKKFAGIPNRDDFKKIKESDANIERYDLRKDWGGDFNVKGETPLPMFMATFPGGPQGSPESYALDILGSVLGGGESSYLNQRYVYSRSPSLSSIYAGNYSMQKTGIFTVGGQLLKGKSIKRVRRNIKRDLKKLCNVAVNDREVQKVKNQYLYSFFSSLETNDGLAELVGRDEAFFMDPERYKKDLNTYLSITADDVMTQCNRLLSSKNPFFITIWNKF